MRAKESVQRRLVDAAVALWGEKGYQGASVQEIVAAAQVTKGAFYHYFESKEILLKQIHDEFVDFEIQRVKAAILEGSNAVEKLTAIMEALAESAAIYQQEVIIFFRDMRFLSPETFAEVRRKRDILEVDILEVVEAGMASGELRPMAHPKVVTFGIVGMCAWVYEWFDRTGEMSGVDIGALYADLVLRGLFNQPGEEVDAPSRLVDTGAPAPDHLEGKP